MNHDKETQLVGIGKSSSRSSRKTVNLFPRFFQRRLPATSGNHRKKQSSVSSPVRNLSSSSKVTVCTYRRDFAYANTMPLANGENKYSLYSYSRPKHVIGLSSDLEWIVTRETDSLVSHIFVQLPMFLPPPFPLPRSSRLFPLATALLSAIPVRNFRTAYRRLRQERTPQIPHDTYTHALAYILSPLVSRAQEVSKTPTNLACCSI